jgi:ABC-type branched-subunit amino acid transport system substrate-binding protein
VSARCAALLGAELLGAGGQGALTLEVRDSASDPARARNELEALAHDGVLAVVGPPDRAESIEVAAGAATVRIPTFAIGADDGRGGPSWFRIARPRVDAARAAAKLLAADRVTRVAILGPDGAAGKELARVFAEEARTRNLQIVAEVRFPEAATTFVREVKQIEASHPQAIFLPATAAQLDLVAPQLATAGLVAMANLKSSGHEARLVATADGLSARTLVRTGKYLQGAVVLPPFWADPGDPRAQAFLERYHEAYGEEPSVLDALAYDAVRSVRLVVSSRGEQRDWGELADGLRQLDAGGLTGRLTFSSDGNRTGEPDAWIVDGNGLRPRGK